MILVMVNATVIVIVQMKISKELLEIAKQEVLSSSHSWLDYDNVKMNLEEKGFVIDEVEKANYKSRLIFSKDGKIKVISLNMDQLYGMDLYKFLLQEYCLYLLNPEVGKGKGFVLGFNTSGEGKNKAKRLYVAIRDESVLKEFGSGYEVSQNDQVNQNKKR